MYPVWLRPSLALFRYSADAVVVETDGMLISAQRQTTLAIEDHQPAIHETREFTQDGGLISYGPSITEMIRRLATFVDKILKGVKPLNSDRAAQEI
jgi:putative ABC transport system substrate-binding protein